MQSLKEIFPSTPRGVTSRKKSLLFLPPAPRNGYRILPAGGGDWSTILKSSSDLQDTTQWLT